jgi:hypothetical protein
MLTVSGRRFPPMSLMQLCAVLALLAATPAQPWAGERALQAEQPGPGADDGASRTRAEGKDDDAVAPRAPNPPPVAARGASRQTDDNPCAATTASQAQAGAPRAPAGASQAPAKARPNDWQRRHRASRILDKPLCGLAGQKLGVVQDIVIDRQGRIAYGVIAVGGVAQADGKLFVVPWRELRPHEVYDQFVLDISRERLLHAPAFDADNWPDITDKRWAREVNRFFAQRNGSPRAIKREPVTERPAGSSQRLNPLETGKPPGALTQRARATTTPPQPNRQETDA